MWRKNTWNLGITISLMIISLLIIVNAEVIINEVEQNPEGTGDLGNEWVELYISEAINITNWYFLREDDKRQNFSLIAEESGYYTITFNDLQIRDSEEELYLYNNESTLIDTIKGINDSNNDIRSWNYCSQDNSWQFLNSSEDEENICPSEEDNNETNDGSYDGENFYFDIKLNKKKMDADEMFDLEMELYDLGDKLYDVRIYVEDNDDKILSEIYDYDGDKWRNGYYYIDEVLEGPDNYTEVFEIRIKERYYSKDGKFNVYARVKPNDNSEEYKQKRETIEINPVGSNSNSNSEDNSGSNSNSGSSNNKGNNKITGYSTAVDNNEDDEEFKKKEGVIYLNTPQQLNQNNQETKDIKGESYSESEEVIYESKEQKIREKIIYGFLIFCILFIIFLIFKKH